MMTSLFVFIRLQSQWVKVQVQQWLLSKMKVSSNRVYDVIRRHLYFLEQRLVIKSSILRLLAELVRSYPVCASLVANHQYKMDDQTLVTQVTDLTRVYIFITIIYRIVQQLLSSSTIYWFQEPVNQHLLLRQPPMPTNQQLSKRLHQLTSSKQLRRIWLVIVGWLVDG